MASVYKLINALSWLAVVSLVMTGSPLPTAFSSFPHTSRCQHLITICSALEVQGAPFCLTLLCILFFFPPSRCCESLTLASNCLFFCPLDATINPSVRSTVAVLFMLNDNTNNRLEQQNLLYERIIHLLPCLSPRWLSVLAARSGVSSVIHLQTT